MRFLFVDQILELELGSRILAAKTVSMADSYWTDHYTRIPVLPASLLLECLLQTGGWLNVAGQHFAVKTVVALIEDVRFYREVYCGERVLLEARMLYAHLDGATIQAEARVGTEVAATAGRIVFGNERTADEFSIRAERERFRNLTRGLAAV